MSDGRAPGEDAAARCNANNPLHDVSVALAPAQAPRPDWLGLDETQLIAELMAAIGALTDVHRRRLADLGVTDEAAERCGGVGVAPVVASGRLYVPSPHGKPALILPVYVSAPPSRHRMVADPRLQDLLAFRTSAPGRWWWRIGWGSCLGYYPMLEAIEGGAPLRLYGDPLAWLRAGGDGFAPLAELEGCEP